MKKLSAKSFYTLIYICGAFFVLVTVGVSVYFVKNLNNASSELAKNKFVNSSYSKKIELLSNLKEDYRSIQPEKDEVEAYLPKDKKVFQLVVDMEKMATDNSLVFDAYQVVRSKKTTVKDNGGDLQIEKRGNYYVLSFDITLKGSFENVKKMIKDIESYGRVTEVTDIKYTKDIGTAARGTDNVEAVLKVSTYFKK